jgi:hypothetical protein
MTYLNDNLEAPFEYILILNSNIHEKVQLQQTSLCEYHLLLNVPLASILFRASSKLPKGVTP